MKKLFFTFILIFTSVMVVDATSISNIDMSIYVDNYGNAYVEEIWDAYVTEGTGTEGLHPYFDLGNSVISDLSVTMDGQQYTTIDSWDINASFSDKAYKAGIYYVNGNEVDICFGISSYGSHTYNLRYKISNFVSTVLDADIIYFTLFPYDFSVEPSNVNIEIYSDFRYADTLDVWGYGKSGAPCYVYDGVIAMTSDGTLGSNEYLTILVKFDKGTFQSSNILDNDFNYYYEMAEKGAVNYNDKSNSVISFIFEFLPLLVWGLIFVFGIGAGVNSSKDKKCSFGETGNKVRKDVPFFREIPCDKDIFYAYWVAHNYNLTEKKEDFLGSVLLKWIRNGNVKIEKNIKDGLFKDKEVTSVVFVTRPSDIELEGTLYDYMYGASNDGKLESDEFKKWCNSNYSKILSWFDDVLYFECLDLIKKGKVTYQSGKTMKVFSYKSFLVDSSMMEVAEQMAGLKKFLKEFTLIKEREPIEVSLWNEYLMYAQIFGIADEVAEQFKKLYPEIITEMDNIGYDYGDIIFIHTITRDGIRSASTAQSRAQSYSSGGGGFSSGGGGGGSFGGGGGGGGFR